MRWYAKKILAPAFVVIVGLGVLAGAEPAEPKPEGLTVEGLPDGQIQIRHTPTHGKPFDLKVERLGDRRFRLTMGGKAKVTCESFQLFDDGKCDLSGNVEMEGNGMALKANRVWIHHLRPDSEKPKLKASNANP